MTRQLRSVFALALLAVDLSPAAQQVPPEIHPPAGERLFLTLHAKGDQVYACKAKTEGPPFAWILRAPDADLFDGDGKPFGRHVAGPSWVANDGSRVNGKAVANVPSPDPDSIPWLLVHVVSHEGAGVLTPTTSIQRLHTKGGKSPASGCDAEHLDQEFRVPYTADYLFFRL
jgi:Protein of unknown function (DUF3455)